MLRALRQWWNVFRWQATHLPLEATFEEPEIEEDADWFGLDALVDLAPTFISLEELEQQRRAQLAEKTFPFEKKQLPGLGNREYDLTGRELPLAPKSAILAPPKLTPSEKKAVEIAETIGEHFVDGLKLKPALRKKLKEREKGYQRVSFDDAGKMTVVKGA